ncbi:MAG TPA: DUF6702 family protein [Chitinophagaceae bacterium]|nr:DUF6702 family protein [Chitinophagaceae bacterium]
MVSLHPLISLVLTVLLLHLPKEKCGDTVHPTYVAVAEINYDNQNNYATLACKTFTDDLEMALQKQLGVKEHLASPADVKKASSEINTYIKSHLQIKINGRITCYAFQNYQPVDNTIVADFRIENIHGISKFEITDSVFYELFDTQIQIIYVTVNGNKKFSSLHNPESNLSFDF